MCAVTRWYLSWCRNRCCLDIKTTNKQNNHHVLSTIKLTGWHNSLFFPFFSFFFSPPLGQHSGNPSEQLPPVQVERARRDSITYEANQRRRLILVQSTSRSQLHRAAVALYPYPIIPGTRAVRSPPEVTPLSDIRCRLSRLRPAGDTRFANPSNPSRDSRRSTLR